MGAEAAQRTDAQARRSRGRPRSNEAGLIETELLDGALREFLRDGYGGTSIGQIVKSLGISKTTLYSRYPSKAALFQAIISARIRLLSPETVLRSGDTGLTLEEGLRAYARRTLEISLEGDLLEVNRLVYSEANRFPELGIASAERSEIGIRQVATFIAECAVRDGIACRDPTGIATAFIFMLRGWYVNVMLTNEPVSAVTLRRFVDQAVRAIIAGRDDW